MGHHQREKSVDFDFQLKMGQLSFLRLQAADQRKNDQLEVIMYFLSNKSRLISRMAAKR